MSTRVTVAVRCDWARPWFCTATVSPSSAATTTPSQARSIARSEGWSCTRKGDYCPLHRPDNLAGVLAREGL